MEAEEAGHSRQTTERRRNKGASLARAAIALLALLTGLAALVSMLAGERELGRRFLSIQNTLPVTDNGTLAP